MSGPTAGKTVINNRLNPKLTARRSAFPEPQPTLANTAPQDDFLDVYREDELLSTKSSRKDSMLTSMKSTNHGTSEHGVIETDPDFEIEVRKKKVNPYSTLNTPMLIAWLHKSYQEEPSAENGLSFLLKHCQKSEGCLLCLKHEAIDIVLVIQRHDDYQTHAPIQLLCLQIFRRLLECNYTRDQLTYSTVILCTAFSISYRFVASEEHLEAGLNCIMQCARSEICRSEIIASKMIGYIVNFCHKHPRNAAIVRPALKVFQWVAITAERMNSVCKMGAIDCTIGLMKRHNCNAKVLAPAVAFLTAAANLLPWGMELILEKRAVPMIISALRSLFDEDELQLEGLKMLQTLATTKEGYKQISETKGGWQSICQGTALGNALLHALEGEFHNPGWAIGDTPNPSILERRKIAAIAESQRKHLGRTAKYAWTTRSLMEFMGHRMTGQTLASTIEYNDAYFELVKSLDLLPHSLAESKEAWFNRLAVYEKENDVTIEEMVRAVLDMKKKDAKRLELEEMKARGEIEQDTKANLGGEYVKPVYAKGRQITMKTMEEEDAAAADLQNL